MKIQGDRPEDLAATSTVTNGRNSRLDPVDAVAGVTPAPDRVDVSSDARLLNHAVQAASRAPEIRTDLVERARGLLASGTLGHDVEALADRMIDHMMRL